MRTKEGLWTSLFYEKKKKKKKKMKPTRNLTYPFNQLNEAERLFEGRQVESKSGHHD